VYHRRPSGVKVHGPGKGSIMVGSVVAESNLVGRVDDGPEGVSLWILNSKHALTMHANRGLIRASSFPSRVCCVLFLGFSRKISSPTS
jgi:hypothetical protein